MEMLFVGVIVLVAASYSTWALLPGPARRRLAERLLGFAASGACPRWLADRIRSTAAGQGRPTGACDGCDSHRPRDGAPR